jgi:endonuclease YncB( thermonuclease family)
MKPSIRTIGLALLAAALVSLVALRVHTRRRRQPPSPTFKPGALARVLHVVDGDTAYFKLDRGGWVKGRLAGINTPECEKTQVRLRSGRRSARCEKDDEFYGLEAYRLLCKLLAAKARLRLDCTRKADGSCRRGRHGRVLITIRVGSTDVAGALVRAGAAWTYTKYPSPDRARLCRAELAARRAKKGMWAAGPVPEVMAMMRARTRKWYRHHDRRCREAMARRAKPTK